MTLTDKEYKTFLKINIDFLFFVGQKSKIIDATMDFKKFMDTGFSIKLKCRNFFLDNKTVLDDYLTTNSERLTSSEVSILTNFKKSITSDFIIFKCLTNHAIFIDTRDNKFYAVKALGDRFDHLIHQFPVLVQTTILPFNNQIIYDGFMKAQGIYFGSGMKATMNEDYKQAKRNNQILTTLL